MSVCSIWRCRQEWAGRLCQRQAAETVQGNAAPSRDEPQAGEAKHDTRMGVSLDGWMVHIIGEGWKEVKSGTFYEVVMGEGKDEVTGEKVSMAQADSERTL